MSAIVRDGLFIFNSIHKVMRAEGVLKRAGCDVKVMPVPRALSSDCGLAIAFILSELDKTREALAHDGCPAEESYRYNDDQYIRLD